MSMDWGQSTKIVTPFTKPGHALMTIFEANSSHREAILAIDPIAENDPDRVAFIDQALQSHVVLIAVINKALVGYGVLEYTFYGQGFISMLYVNESYRRQGTGTALMEALIERCSTQKLFTSTNESNAPMHALLQTLGFSRSGVIHNLDPGDPEWVYFKNLAT